MVKDGEAGRLDRCHSNMPDEKAAAVLIAIECLGQKTSCLGKSLDTGLPLTACRRADNKVQWAYEKSLSYQDRAGTVGFPTGVPE